MTPVSPLSSLVEAIASHALDVHVAVLQIPAVYVMATAHEVPALQLTPMRGRGVVARHAQRHPLVVSRSEAYVTAVDSVEESLESLPCSLSCHGLRLL